LGYDTMKYKNMILILLISLAVLIPIVSAQIVADEVTETSIVWNLTGLPAGTVIGSIAFDGILISNYDLNSTRLVQNNLYPSEAHIITVIDSLGNKYEAEATTIESQQTWMWTQINTWFYLILIISIMVVGLVVRRNPVLCFSLNLLASALSLYALYLWLQLNPAQITDIYHLPFYVYIFFFVFPLAAWIFEKKGR
jgi:hypothetical protein